MNLLHGRSTATTHISATTAPAPRSRSRHTRTAAHAHRIATPATSAPTTISFRSAARPSAPTRCLSGTRSRAELLLGPCLEGSVVPNVIDYALHAHSRICATPRWPAEDLRRRDDEVLLGRPSGDGFEWQRRSRAIHCLGAPADFLEKQSTPPDTRRPRCGARASRCQPTLRWSPTLGAKDYHLQVATEPTFASPHRRRQDRLDRVHGPEDVRRRQDVVLAGASRRREPDEHRPGADLVRVGDVPDRPPEARARSCDADDWRFESSGASLVPR